MEDIQDSEKIFETRRRDAQVYKYIALAEDAGCGMNESVFIEDARLCLPRLMARGSSLRLFTEKKTGKCFCLHCKYTIP